MITGISLNLTFLGEGSKSEVCLASCSRISILTSIGIRDLTTPFLEVATSGTFDSWDESEWSSLASFAFLLFLAFCRGFLALESDILLFLVELRVVTLLTDATISTSSSTLGCHLSGFSIPTVLP